MTIGLSVPAWADGGAGGSSNSGNGGSGGSSYTGNSGGTGYNSCDCPGGGGGGGGAGGGSGGQSLGGDATGNGGAGGSSVASPNGQPAPSSNVGAGGGGGGGGFNGNGAGTNNLNNLSPLTGGNGGDGASGGYIPLEPSGGGGGGGAGGYGAVVTGAPSNSNLSTIVGGNGGDGGTAGGYSENSGYANGGNGGDGGVGVFFAVPNAIFANTGAVTGGNGGQGGAASNSAGVSGVGGPGVIGNQLTIYNSGSITGGNGGAAALNGTPGSGGVGVIGSGLTITNTGSITGGLSGDGTTQAYAIVLTGGANYVGGTGNINGGIDVAAGTFQPSVPDSAVGVPLAINGPLVFSSSSTYQVRVTPSASGHAAVTGSATIAGAAVNIVVATPVTSPAQYMILSATGGFNGAFASISTASAFFRPYLSSDSTHIYAALFPINAISVNVAFAGLQATVPDYRPVAATSNQTAVAGALTKANIRRTAALTGAAARIATATTTPSDDDIAAVAATPLDKGGKILASLNQLSAAQARATFDNLSGEGLAGAQSTAHTTSALFTSALADATTFYAGNGAPANSVTLSDAAPSIRELGDDTPALHVVPVDPSRSWRAWGSAFGGAETLGGDGGHGTATQNDTVYGGLIGVDHQLIPNLLLGLAVGGSEGNFSVPGRQTSGSTTGGHFGLYDLATFGRFYGASSLTASVYGNRTTRLLDGFADIAGETDHASFASRELRARLEFGRHLDVYRGFEVTPFVAMEIATLRSDGFSETALKGPSLLGLEVPGQSSPSAPAFVGARLQRTIPLAGYMLTPILQLAYVHDFAPERSLAASLAGVTGSSFVVDGAPAARNAAQTKIGGTLALSPSMTLSANFDGTFSDTTRAYAGQGGIKIVW